jgi:predicted heme/steroid binding protein
MLAFTATISLTDFTQENHTEKNQEFSYVYISVEGKVFSKKLKVEVDFGDTPEQIQAGQDYSEALTNKKSYAAVLNYMADEQFELVETHDLVSFTQGTGGTIGVVFILKKRK